MAANDTPACHDTRMRRFVVLLALAACAPSVVAHMPPDVAARSNPNADTSKNPIIKEYRDSLAERVWRKLRPDVDAPTSSTAHYYTGCGGCAATGGDGVAPLLVLLLLVHARRRPAVG